MKRKRREKGSSGRKNAGRPQVQFKDAGASTKRRKVAHMHKNMTADELLQATKTALRKESRLDEVKLIQEMEKSPTRAKKINAAWKVSQDKPREYTDDEALALLMDNNLSKHQYQNLRSGLSEKQKGNRKTKNVYPPYEKVLEAKQKCYPENMVIEDSFAKVPVQSLLNHTTSRLVDMLENVLERIPEDARQNLVLVSKWGLDGSSGHAQYKQNFQNQDLDDNDMMVISLVPLQLQYESTVLWRNDGFASSRFCRPIKLSYTKENTEKTKQEVQQIKNEIKELLPTSTQVGNIRVTVTHDLRFTMADVKVFNAVSDTKATCRCFLCNALPSEVNSPDIWDKEINEEYLDHGLSILHAWLRLMEWLFKLGVRVKVQKYKITKKNVADKKTVEQEEERIKKEFKSVLQLRLYEPRQGGCGNSNDGNTARKFFREYAETARILGLRVELVQMCYHLLVALSTGLPLNHEKLAAFCHKIFSFYNEHYSWYPMPPTAHKIVVHTPQFAEHFELPIGMFTEEPQESRNKHIKEYRRNFSRKDKREHNMQDVFQRLLVTSDPKISSMNESRRQRRRDARKELPHEVLELLQPFGDI